MTKKEAAQAIGIEGQTFDYALPQTWVDDSARLTGHTGSAICGNFVWLYDDGNRNGRPCALTTDGNKILTDINRVWGTSYPLTANAVQSAHKMYLGDGVYADYDGYQVTLYTSDGYTRSNEIFLDPTTIEALQTFLAYAWATFTERDPEVRCKIKPVTYTVEGKGDPRCTTASSSPLNT